MLKSFISALAGFCFVYSPMRAQPQNGLPLQFSNVTDISERAGWIKQLAAGLVNAGIAGQVIDCEIIISITPVSAHGDKSAGAACRVNVGTQTVKLLLCTDTLWGHFALTTDIIRDPSMATDSSVTEFTSKNCISG